MFDPSGKSVPDREVELAKGRSELAEREARVGEIVVWLHNNQRPVKARSWSSYWLKQLAERQLGYVTNGEFIAAGLMAGYPYRYEVPNVLFGVSEQDRRRLSAQNQGGGRG